MSGRRAAAALAAVLAVTVVAAALNYAGGSPVAIATESVGARFGPAATGVLQSTLGNLPELFVVLFAVSAGEIVVAKTSILGSLFANALLVLGLTIVAGAGASRDRVMRFRARLPNDTATLMLLAVFIIAILGVSNRASDSASAHQVAISVVGAACLLAVYGAWLWSYLRGEGKEAMEAPPARERLPFQAGIVLLAAAGVGAAFVSDWFVGALDSAVKSLGISKAFTGIVIVGIAGNAVENVVGIFLAAKGQADLAISVVKNSVAQIAVFLFPALVLLSLFFTHRLTFVLSGVFVAALALTALAMWQVTGDGEATLFEGMALIALFIILAALAYYE